MTDLSEDQQKRADRLAHDSILVDMCWTTNPVMPMSAFDGKSSLDRALAGGITAAANTLVGERASFRQSLQEINQLYLLEQVERKKVIVVHTVGDILRAKEEGKLGTIIHFQTGTPVEDDWPNTLPVLHKLGLRIMALTYNEKNLIGSGCHEPRDEGLTAYGIQVVKAMNALGILIDLSHVGRHTAMETVRLSKAPVLFTHSNADTLTPHMRSMTDEMIRALRDNGGVIGIASYAPFCVQKEGAKPTITDFLDHLEYMLDLAGEDHVGIGTDINENVTVFPIPAPYELQYGPIVAETHHGLAIPARHTDGGPVRVKGFERLENINNVARGLVARGHSDELVVKILGGNFMRVAREVWS